jgi:hypothetical protein
MKTEHRHFVCAANGHYARCGNSRLKARWAHGPQARVPEAEVL